MKKFRTLIAAFCLTLAYAHTQNTYLWPITGVQPGTRIVVLIDSLLYLIFNKIKPTTIS
ncbi:hypothetical protein [Culturomica massiliensis]|uniref:hypothetical protein n=1 Tax=Culturomica massiliensis TaxID=1841857 RepID=UPI000A676A1E|nr:hypothetical protein [Culturomica massiliensis]